MTSESLKAQGKNITRTGLTGSLLRIVRPQHVTVHAQFEAHRIFGSKSPNAAMKVPKTAAVLAKCVYP